MSGSACLLLTMAPETVPVGIQASSLVSQQGEQRNVIYLGYAFGIARPQPSDDPAQEMWQCHVLESFR
jgi:hypothetical protein